jgi:hypothetical protein
VFLYKYDKSNRKAEPFEIYRIQADSKLSPGICEVIKKVDDIEAAATYKNKLYLLSSHSLNKRGDQDPSRELILEIEQFTGSKDKAVAHVARVATLKGIVGKLEELTKKYKGKLEKNQDKPNIEIEGLAIDKHGCAYIGLRHPLLQIERQGFAIVLRMSVDSIFSASPEAKINILRLEYRSKGYGITSLEYDPETGEILILGNSPKKDKFFPPKLWVWRPNDDPIQTPRLSKNWSLMMPQIFKAKPEAIVLHADKGFVFIDAVGYGGQRVYSREELGLPKAGGS